MSIGELEEMFRKQVSPHELDEMHLSSYTTFPWLQGNCAVLHQLQMWPHALTETAPLKPTPSYTPQTTTVLTQDFWAGRQIYKKGYLKRKIYFILCRCLSELCGACINNDMVCLVWRNVLAELVPILLAHESFVANLAQIKNDWVTETLWFKKQQISTLLS